MDIIELTRELGKAIQADPRFVEMQLARQASDEDQELQDAIGEFNLKRMAISNEAAKPDRNDETMQRLNKEFREVYAKIMANEHMVRYDAAKTEFDAMFQRVKGILDLCAEGGDPETCDYDAANCTGDCSTCGGGCN